MNKNEQSRLIYSGKYPLPLEAATKKSYKILILRSRIKYGLIESIKTPEIPENYYILGYKDIPGRKDFIIDGFKIPVLARDYVNYIGEPILIILGSETKTLENIHKNIEVIYKELKAEDITYFSRAVSIGDADGKFLLSNKIVTGKMGTPARIINKKLPVGSFTKRESDSLTIHTSALWGKDLRDNISSICNLESNKVKIVSPNITGEDEDVLLDNYYSSAFTSISSSAIKKNVFYALTPNEQYQYSSNDYGLTGTWKMAFDKNNKLLGIKVEITLDCGAYPVFLQEKVLRILHGVTSMYKFKNIDVSVTAVKSNKPPVGITNGLYLGEALFFSELLISKIVKETGDDQFLWRKNNILKKGNKNNTMAIIKNELPLYDMLVNIANTSDFLRKNSSINLSLKRKDKRIALTGKKGIGISTGYNGNSFISNDKDLMGHSIGLKLDRDGIVDIMVSCKLRNLELLTIWEDMVSDILDIKTSDITFHIDDTSEHEDSSPNIDNKNITSLTGLLKQCCEEIKVRRFKDPLPIIQTKVSRRTSSVIWDPEKWIGDPFKNSSYGTCAMEVEVDKKSLSIIIKEIWIEIEAGQVIHKQSLINSIHREILSTINWLIGEEPLFEDGEFKLSQCYNRIKIKSKPNVNISLHDSGKGKPKSIGSLIRNILPGAFIQSVNQALGANINFFPITRERVFKELKKDEI